jgi:Fuc2NAc and GlcNAc transferase
MNCGWLLLIAFTALLFMTVLIRRYAKSKTLLDISNARSSHSLAMPIAICVKRYKPDALSGNLLS